MFAKVYREERTNDALLCSMLGAVLSAPPKHRTSLEALGKWQAAARPDDPIQLEESAIIHTRRPWLAEFTKAAEGKLNFAQYLGEVNPGTWMIAQDSMQAGNNGLVALIEFEDMESALGTLRGFFRNSRRPFLLLATTNKGRLVACTRLAFLLK